MENVYPEIYIDDWYQRYHTFAVPNQELKFHDGEKYYHDIYGDNGKCYILWDYINRFPEKIDTLNTDRVPIFNTLYNYIIHNKAHINNFSQIIAQMPLNYYRDSYGKYYTDT